MLQLPRAAQIEVFDLSGRRLRTVALPAGRPLLELRGLPAGLYLVRATAADGSTAIRRLAVQ